VKFAEVETWREGDVGLTETEMGGGAEVRVIVALARFELSATEVAVSVILAGLGIVAGAE